MQYTIQVIQKLSLLQLLSSSQGQRKVSCCSMANCWAHLQRELPQIQSNRKVWIEVYEKEHKKAQVTGERRQSVRHDFFLFKLNKKHLQFERKTWFAILNLLFRKNWVHALKSIDCYSLTITICNSIEDSLVLNIVLKRCHLSVTGEAYSRSDVHFL